MSTKREDGSPSSDATENRRWLIGVGISLVFGVFGVVMALLSYSERSKSPDRPAATPRTIADPARDGDRKRRNRD